MQTLHSCWFFFDRSDIKHVSVQTPCSEKVQTYRRGKCSHTGGNTVFLYTRSPHKFCIYKISLAVAFYDIHIYIYYMCMCVHACMWETVQERVKQHATYIFIFVQTRMFHTCTCITVFNKSSLALQLETTVCYSCRNWKHCKDELG